jgi:hypothetical protein
MEQQVWSYQTINRATSCRSDKLSEWFNRDNLTRLWHERAGERRPCRGITYHGRTRRHQKRARAIVSLPGAMFASLPLDVGKPQQLALWNGVSRRLEHHQLTMPYSTCEVSFREGFVRHSTRPAQNPGLFPLLSLRAGTV